MRKLSNIPPRKLGTTIVNVVSTSSPRVVLITSGASFVLVLFACEVVLVGAFASSVLLEGGRVGDLEVCGVLVV